MKLEMIVKWLKDSGLKVNENKTELCMFHRNNSRTITVTIHNTQIISKKSMNVLVVTFDSKLNWSDHVSRIIARSNKSLCALRMIKRYLPPPVMKTLLVSNYYSILYYNAEIWLSKNLSVNCKQLLLSASANAIRSCSLKTNQYISFEKIHEKAKLSTPMQMANFILTLLLYKTFNSNTFNKYWLELNDQIVITGRKNHFNCYRKNNYKIGLNLLVNRFHSLNNKVWLDDLNLNFLPFKRKMKCAFRPYEL
jgi:hypothetical protein